MFKINDYSHARRFDEMGKVLFEDPSCGLVIRAGNIFEARTVKGHTNLIMAMRVLEGWLYYVHADKVRKVRMEEFVSSVMHGDLQPRSYNEVDVGRLSMAGIALDSVANRRTGEETIQYYGEQCEERHMRGA